jgi:hypothetical protein
MLGNSGGWDSFLSVTLFYRVSDVWREYVCFVSFRRHCQAFVRDLKGGSSDRITRVFLAPRKAELGQANLGSALGVRSVSAEDARGQSGRQPSGQTRGVGARAEGGPGTAFPRACERVSARAAAGSAGQARAAPQQRWR